MDYVTAPDWAPPGLIVVIVLAAFAAAGLLAHMLISALVRRVVRKRDEFLVSLIERAGAPTRLAFLLIALAIGAPYTPLTGAETNVLRHVVLIGSIVLVGWVALVALDIAANLYQRRLKIDVADNMVARKHLTQVRILKRAAATLIIIVTVALAMMTVAAVRQYGVSLLAAGGAAGIIVGLALQPLLTNLIAGIQIAVTQPIRIDDAVIVENEWGWIEEITSTYVVVRLWDWRRLVLPLTYFIQTPFQNWTRETADLIGTVFLPVDYEADVPAMRAKLEEIAAASPLWDGKVVNLAVTEVTEQVMQVRCLVSAKNAPTCFDLRCEVREKMVAWLTAEHPAALSRQRLTLERAR